MSSIFAKSGNPINPTSELVKSPSGRVQAGDGSGHYLPPYIRNGTFQCENNGYTFTPAVGGAVTTANITDGWKLNQNGNCVVNSDVALKHLPTTQKTGASHRQLVTVVSVGGTTADYVQMDQVTYDLRQYAGKTLALEFSAYANSARTIAVEFIADEANGNSTIIGGGQFDITTNEKTFVTYASIPELSTTALGTLHKLTARFWLVAGTDYDTRLGSGVSASTGVITFTEIRDLSKSGRPTKIEENAACEKYYKKINYVQFFAAIGTSSFSNSAILNIPLDMAYNPTNANCDVTNTSFVTGSVSISSLSNKHLTLLAVPNNPTSAARMNSVTVDLRL